MATEMFFLRRMPRISCIEKKSSETMFLEADTTKSLINRIRKRQATFFGRREKQDDLLNIGVIEGKRSSGQQYKKMLNELTKWLKVGQARNTLKATRDKDAYQVMITFTKDQRSYLVK